MSKILVTGGAGYIGSTLVPDLLAQGHEVTVVDNLMYKQTSLASTIRNKNLELVIGDVRDESLMKSHVSKADVIIPLAAIVGAPACDKDPIAAKSINRDSIFWLLENISKNQQLIMPTTNSAYGSGDKNNFCDENSSLNPLSLYARDKVEVENALMQHENATSFRLATVFGLSPRMRLDLLVNNFVFRALTDGFIIIFEGHFKRNYIHVLDVVQAFNLALKNPSEFRSEIFNVGLSEANISKLELCEVICNLVPNFTFMEAPLGKDPDQRNYIVSNQKIEQKGFKPTVMLAEGIEELIRGIRMFNHKPFTNL
jgi:nucleoside-diphosphate-sugar epimerase